MTTIPFLEAEPTSILSTPIPALPITLNLLPAPIIFSVTFVDDLTANPS